MSASLGNRIGGASLRLHRAEGRCVKTLKPDSFVGNFVGNFVENRRKAEDSSDEVPDKVPDKGEEDFVMAKHRPGHRPGLRLFFVSLCFEGSTRG